MSAQGDADSLKAGQRENEAKATENQEAGTGKVPAQEQELNDSYNAATHKYSGIARKRGRIAPLGSRRDTRRQVYHYYGASAGQSHE